MGSKACVTRLQKEYRAILKVQTGRLACGVKRGACLVDDCLLGSSPSGAGDGLVFVGPMRFQVEPATLTAAEPCLHRLAASVKCF